MLYSGIFRGLDQSRVKRVFKTCTGSAKRVKQVLARTKRVKKCKGEALGARSGPAKKYALARTKNIRRRRVKND